MSSSDPLPDKEKGQAKPPQVIDVTESLEASDPPGSAMKELLESWKAARLQYEGGSPMEVAPIAFTSTFRCSSSEVVLIRVLLQKLLIKMRAHGSIDTLNFSYDPVEHVGTDLEVVSVKIIFVLQLSRVGDDVTNFLSCTDPAPQPSIVDDPQSCDSTHVADLGRALLGIVPTWTPPIMAVHARALGSIHEPPIRQQIPVTVSEGRAAVLPAALFSHLHKTSDKKGRLHCGSVVFATVNVPQEQETELDAPMSWTLWKEKLRPLAVKTVSALLASNMGLTFEKTPDRAPMMLEITKHLSHLKGTDAVPTYDHLRQYVEHLRATFRSFLDVQNDEQAVAADAAPVAIKERPVPHALTHCDVSSVIWWRDCSNPPGVLSIAVLLDTPGVVQRDASFAAPPPLPSAELELQLASLHIDDDLSHAPPPHAMQHAEDAPPCVEDDSGADIRQEASEPNPLENEGATAAAAAETKPSPPPQGVDERISETLVVQSICRFIGESYQQKLSPLKWSQERVQTCRRILTTPRYFYQAAAVRDAEKDASSAPHEAVDESTAAGAPTTRDLDFFHQTVSTNFFLPQDQSMLDNIQLVFLVLLRRSSSVAANPFLDAISDPLSIRVLCDLLYHSHPKIRFESAWVLTNIASGTTDQITKLNTPATFARILTPLLDSDVDVVEQIVWLVGNIVGDGPMYRDMFLAAGVHILLMDIFDANHASPQLCRQLAWVFSNFCRGRNVPLAHTLPLCSLLPILCASTDTETRIDTYWMASYMTTNSEVESIRGLLNPIPYAGLRRRSGGPNAAVLGFRGNPARPYYSVADQTYNRLQKYFFHGSCKGIFRTFLLCQERRRSQNKKTLEGSMVQHVFNMCPQIVVSCLDHFRQVLSENARPPVTDSVGGSERPALKPADLKLITPIVRTIGNIAACTDGSIVQVLVDKGFINLLLRCLGHPSVYARHSLVKEMFWIMSNFAAGTAPQIILTMESGIMPIAMKVLVQQAEAAHAEDVLPDVTFFGESKLPFHVHPNVAKEALYVFANLIENRTCLDTILRDHKDWVYAFVYFFLRDPVGSALQLKTTVAVPVMRELGRHPAGPQVLREALAQICHAPGQTSPADAARLLSRADLLKGEDVGGCLGAAVAKP